MKNIILSMVLGAALLGSAQACGCAAHRGQQHRQNRPVMCDGVKHHHHYRGRHAQRPGHASIRGAGNHTAFPKAEVAPSVHKPQAPQAQAPRKYKVSFGHKNHRPFWGPNARRHRAAK